MLHARYAGRMKRWSLGILLLGLVIPRSLMAQVYLCEGKYTSTPCDDRAKALDLKPVSRAHGNTTQEERGAENSSSDPAGEASQEVPQGTSGTFTRLRTASKPLWTLELDGAFVHVKSGEVIVKNVGRKTAQGVVVSVNIPGKASKFLRMTGPELLAAGESALYSFKETSTIPRGAPINIKMECSNCWK